MSERPFIRIVPRPHDFTEAQRLLIWYVNAPPKYEKQMLVTWRQLQRRGIAGNAALTPLGWAVRRLIAEQGFAI